MNCPLCGSKVSYQGLTQVECEGFGCPNGHSDPLKGWEQDPVQPLWRHVSGKLVYHVSVFGLSSYAYGRYNPKGDGLGYETLGMSPTLEEAQQLAMTS